MQKDVVIKYLPNTTTKEEIDLIRNKNIDNNTILILIISGKESLLDNIQSMINID